MKKKRILFLFLIAITFMTIFAGNKIVDAIERINEKTTNLEKKQNNNIVYLNQLRRNISKDEINIMYTSYNAYKKSNVGIMLIDLNTKLNGYYTEKKHFLGFLSSAQDPKELEKHNTNVEKLLYRHTKYRESNLNKEVELYNFKKLSIEATNKCNNQKTIEMNVTFQSIANLCKEIFLRHNNLFDIFEYIDVLNDALDSYVMNHLSTIKDIFKETIKKIPIKDQVLIEEFDNKYGFLVEDMNNNEEIINIVI